LGKVPLLLLLKHLLLKLVKSLLMLNLHLVEGYTLLLELLLLTKLALVLQLRLELVTR
jgi:hypothetical protein